MELLAGAFPPDFVEKLYSVVETLQQQLGEINDHVTAQARFRQRIDRADDPSEVDHFRTLLEDEHASLNRSRRTFLQWWTPQRKDDLRARFNELLADRHELATGGDSILCSRPLEGQNDGAVEIRQRSGL